MQVAEFNLSLQQRFCGIATRIDASDAAVAKWSQEFFRRYTESQRHYHTLTHIYDMFVSLDDCRSLVEDQTALSLAIFFHDWVYDPKRSDNELESIKYFQDFASEVGLADALSSRVSGYIERTITHTLPVTDIPTDNSDLKLFLDFDLDVLSRTEEQYSLYAEQIRAEYGHVEPNTYCFGRTQVLKSFLTRDYLYFTDSFRDGREEKARNNLQKEVSALEGEYGPMHVPSF